MENTKGRKRTLAIIAVVVCLALAAVGGTIAWLNSQSNLTNSFTVGDVNDPTTEPGDPDEPLPDDSTKVDGNLYEPNWVDESKILPGTQIAKDPYVGIGKGSEDAYVFVYVKNNTMSDSGSEASDAPYFTLNGNWAVVTDGGSPIGDKASENLDAYTNGLFMYSADGINPVLLEGFDDKDNWTVNPLFSAVMTPEDANGADFAENPTIEVYSYVIVVTSPQEAVEAAIAWADDPTGPVIE